MAYLLAYKWEKETFPEMWGINIEGEKRVPLAMAILKHYGNTRVRVLLATNGRGLAKHYGPNYYEVDLPKAQYPCALGLIIHECAHVLTGDWCAEVRGYRSEGHGPRFKKNLIKLMVEMKMEYPKMAEAIDRELGVQREAAMAEAAKQTKMAVKKVEAKEYRKTRAYKIERTTRRIMKLERKLKNLSSRLKSAKRLLDRLHRAEAKEKQKISAPPVVA
jgi:hypothetical protein